MHIYIENILQIYSILFAIRDLPFEALQFVQTCHFYLAVLQAYPAHKFFHHQVQLYGLHYVQYAYGGL